MTDSDLTTAFIYGERLFYVETNTSDGGLVKRVVPIRILAINVSGGKILELEVQNMNEDERFTIYLDKFENIHQQSGLKAGILKSDGN